MRITAKWVAVTVALVLFIGSVLALVTAPSLDGQTAAPAVVSVAHATRVGAPARILLRDVSVVRLRTHGHIDR